MRSVKVCFEFLSSVHILDHSIYVNNLPSGITTANTITLQLAKDNLLDYDHCCFCGGVMLQDCCLKIPPNFYRQYKFPEIHKNHLAEAVKCSRTPDTCFISLSAQSFK